MTQENPKLHVAHLTDVLDGRQNSGTARAAREFILGLSNYENVSQTLIHFEKTDDRIYSMENVNEIIIPLINFPFAKHFLSFLFFWIKQRFIHKTYKFDIVHWHSSRVYPLFYLIPGRKVIITLHDATNRIMREVNTVWTRIFYWNLRFSMRRVHVIIGDSLDACHNLSAFGKFPSNKISCLYLASNFDEIEPEIPVKLDSTKKFFLCVSRWQPHKNVERLVEAYALATKVNPTLPKLVLVGKPVAGYEVPSVKIRDFELADRIIVLKDLSDSELVYLYDHAILNIVPSLHEGFGFTVLEGLKRNCPSLDHAFTSTSEISNSAGMHIDMSSVDEISNALLTFVGSPAFQLELKSKTQERASLFTWAKTISNLLQIYTL